MKHIKERFEFEKEKSNKLIKNEETLKNLLLKDKDFANGEILQGIINIIHEHFWSEDMSYDEIVHYIIRKFGYLIALSLLLSKYNYQVGNGGHLQYYDNGYASDDRKGENIEIHDKFVELFKELKMDKILPDGEKAYNIINSFELDLEDELEPCNCNDGYNDCYTCSGNGVIDCPECNGDGEIDDEECNNCRGDGTIPCEDCGGDGTFPCEDCGGNGEYETGNRIPDTAGWERLDSRWYLIDNNIINQFENYIKKQTLGDEKIEDLVDIANSTQLFNL